MNDTAREMTLQEYIRVLPPFHTARKQFEHLWLMANAAALGVSDPVEQALSPLREALDATNPFEGGAAPSPAQKVLTALRFLLAANEHDAANYPDLPIRMAFATNAAVLNQAREAIALTGQA